MQNQSQTAIFEPLMLEIATDKMRLWHIVQVHAELMKILKTLQTLDASAYVAAGVLRHVVWASLHGVSYSLEGTEVDVIFYDHHDVADQRARSLTIALQEQYPEIQWDITNQATVHTWYRTEKDECIAALLSIEQALSFWPETATALALRLDQKHGFELIAPLGLHDLFELKLRWNPALVSYELFEQRYRCKCFLEKWPKLQLINHEKEPVYTGSFSLFFD